MKAIIVGIVAALVMAGTGSATAAGDINTNTAPQNICASGVLCGTDDGLCVSENTCARVTQNDGVPTQDGTCPNEGTCPNGGVPAQDGTGAQARNGAGNGTCNRGSGNPGDGTCPNEGNCPNGGVPAQDGTGAQFRGGNNN